MRVLDLAEALQAGKTGTQKREVARGGVVVRSFWGAYIPVEGPFTIPFAAAETNEKRVMHLVAVLGDTGEIAEVGIKGLPGVLVLAK